MSFEIIFSKKFDRKFRKLDKNIQKKIFDIIKKLREDPFCCNAKKLAGYERLFRIRIGNYRLIYEINFDKKRIEILTVNSRGKVYKNF
jgi:mRNA interferase RelE/StbE